MEVLLWYSKELRHKGTSIFLSGLSLRKMGALVENEERHNKAKAQTHYKSVPGPSHALRVSDIHATLTIPFESSVNLLVRLG